MTQTNLARRPVEQLIRELLHATREAIAAITMIEASGIIAPDLARRCREAFVSGQLFDVHARDVFGQLVDAVREAVASETRVRFDAYESGINELATEIVETTELSPRGRALQPNANAVYEIERRLVACEVAIQAQRTLRALMH